MLADLDLTEMPVIVEYECGHVDSELMTSESLTTTSFRYEDGVLHIPTACAACLDRQEGDVSADALVEDGWPWDDGEDQFAGVFEPFPPGDSPVYWVPN